MTRRTLLWRALLVTGVLLVVALSVGAVYGVPVGLGYVETGSMSPTLEAGDGFVAVPAEISGPVEEGDVVVFDAQELDGGGLTTHRVVETTEHGYVTRGDANPATDQSGNEPHVTDGQVVAVALQVDGEVLTIPHLGTGVLGIQSGLESLQWHLASVLGTTAVLGTQGLAIALFTVGFTVIVLSMALERWGSVGRERSRTRSRPSVYDPRTVVLAVACVLCVVTLATMIATSGSTELGIVSAEFDSDRPDVIPVGESETHTRELHNGGALPVVSILEPSSEGLEVDEEPKTMGRGESVDASVSVTAPDETGYYVRSFSEYRYLAVLPPPVIATLHAVHPWLALTTVTGVVVVVFTLPTALVVGAGTIRTRTRERTDRSSGFDW